MSTTAAEDVQDEARQDEEAVGASSMLPSSTAGVNPEIDNPCSSCCDAQAELLSAMENAENAARLQARLQALLQKAHALAMDQADASVQLESCLKTQGDSRTMVESLQAQSRNMESEKQRLTQSNKKLAKDLPLENYYVEEEEGWKEAHARNRGFLDAQSEKYVVKEARLRRVLDMKKHSEEVLSRQKIDKNAVYRKVHQQLKINRSMRKRLSSVAPLLADISRHCSESLPEHLRVRMEKLPIDDMLEVLNTKEDDTGEGFDNVLERLLEKDSGRYRFTTKPGGKGSRGGHGAYKARWAANQRKVVDESMHEELLDRKLHRNDPDVQPAAPIEPAAKSVMGKKMESVRELQERKKGDTKHVIAELKKNIEKKDHPANGEKSAASNSGGRAMVASDADLFQLGVARKVNRQSVRNGPFTPGGNQQKKSRDVETMLQQRSTAPLAPPRSAKSAPIELSELGLDVSDSD